MDVFAFGFNADGQITGPKSASCDVETNCLEPTKVYLACHDTECVDSETQVKDGGASTPTATSTSIKPHANRPVTDLSQRTVCTAVSWSNIICIIDGHLHINGWHDRKASQNYNCPQHNNIKHISTSWKRTFFVSRDGQCHVWENGNWSVTPKRVKLPDDLDGITFDVVQSGEVHTVAITGNGDIGLVDSTTDGTYIYRALASKLNVKQVSCGKEHVLILTRIGEVYSYGGGSRGQLGHGSANATQDVRVVEALEGVTMATVASGGWHSTAVSDMGDLYVWGWNESGQLGLPCKQLHNQNKCSRVHCCRCSSSEQSEFVNILTLPAALDFDRCSECDSKSKDITGVLEDCDDLKPPSPRESFGTETTDVKAVACGSRHTIALAENGLVYTWGWNGHGQLGHGDTTSRDRPTLLRTFKYDSTTCVDVNAGYWNSLIVAKRRQPCQ